MKRRNIKRRVIIFISIIIMAVSILAVVLSWKRSDAIKIAPIIDEILYMDKVSNCKIKSLDDYSDIKIDINNPCVSQKEIDKYVIDKLQDYGEEVLTDEFVKTNLECETVDEYLEKVTQTILEKKKIELIIMARKDILNKLLKISTFDIDEEEIIEYALNTVYGYETEAYLYDMNLQEYAETILNIPYDMLFEKCYEESETVVKTYLIIGAIAYRENLTDVYDADNIYLEYQELENKVYSLFIKVEEGF